MHKRWLRALLLDLLLSDIFVKLTSKTRPDFASLFVNAGAHIQHHYLFSSSAYEGQARNPAWYVTPGDDPVLDAYEMYDTVIGQVLRRLPRYRLIVATGLRQVPHEKTTFYWRLRDHQEFLRRIGVHASGVEPRMSRDFIVRFDSAVDAARSASLLGSARAADGVPLFEVDNRGLSLFVMLTYPHDIPETLAYWVDGTCFPRLRDEVAFVAIKNGQHDGIGYWLDTSVQPHDRTEMFALRELPARIRLNLSGRGLMREANS